MSVRKRIGDCVCISVCVCACMCVRVCVHFCHQRTTPPIWPPGVPTVFGTDANFKRELYRPPLLCPLKDKRTNQEDITQTEREKKGGQELGVGWKSSRIKGNKKGRKGK